MKKGLKYISIIGISLTIIFGVLVPAKADSGFDTSYDSGGGYSSSSSSSSNYSGGASPVTVIILGIIIIMSNIVDRKKLKSQMDEKEYNKLIKDISMDDMQKKVFEIYERLQYAWSNFDYDEIKKYTTDELYNMYTSQLDTLKIKAQQNVMKDIILEKVKITNVVVENDITTVSAYLVVNCYDYLIDTRDNKVLRGNSKQKLQLEYEITLIKDNNSKESVTCPSCGAKVNITTSKTCEYCHTLLVQNASDYVMSAKRMISQNNL